MSLTDPVGGFVAQTATDYVVAHHNVEHLHYIGEWDDARLCNAYLADEFRPTLSIV